LIVFNLLTFPGGGGEPTGGLYAIRPGQEQPRQLTDNPRDYDPSFAPSGKQLVFRRTDSADASSSGIYTLDLSSGKTTRIPSRGSDLNPAFGPRGMIAFSRSVSGSAYDLFLRSPNGRIRRLTSSAAKDGEPVFTPDGRRIIFVRSYGHPVALTGSERKTPAPPQLFSIRTDGTGLHSIGSPRRENFDISPDGHHMAFAGVGGISYSPDGRKIAYANHGGLWLRRADGQGKPTLALETDYNGYEEGQLLIQPAWQPLP
jgi:Tol biopolymer transport system component